MAQIAARTGTRTGRGRTRLALRLYRRFSHGWSVAVRRSRERSELDRAVSSARVGRETGVKC